MTSSSRASPPSWRTARPSLSVVPCLTPWRRSARRRCASRRRCSSRRRKTRTRTTSRCPKGWTPRLCAMRSVTAGR
nr:MAG TPA: hypothetical protein [Caudoviricetes sp.]